MGTGEEMKKIFIIIEAILLTVLLCACHNETPADESNVTTETETADELGQEVYSDEELGIRVYESSSKDGGYYVSNMDTVGYIDSAVNYENVRDIRVEAWGEDFPFLAAVIADKSAEHVYIADFENLGEIRITNPYETVQEYIGIEALEEKEAIQADKDISFHSDDTGIYAEIPLRTSVDNSLGSFRLYYEFDGVGLKCISAEFMAEDTLSES